MLRLPPSEICLTPEDIDETFRRIAQRQALRGARRGSSQRGRPVLHRGPQRFVRDAITTLGDIPLLRPQPQQAILSSADDDTEDDAEQPLLSSSDRNDPLSTASPLQDGQIRTPPLRVMHLPLRIGRPRHDEDTQAGVSTSPHAHPPASNVGDGGATADLSASGHHTPRTPPAISPSPVDMRGGGRPHKRDRRGTSGESFSTPSPTRQGQPEDPHTGGLTPEDPSASNTADGKTPILYLQGYPVDPVKNPKGPEYWFRESIVVPQTEPRRASGRYVVPTRSLSSGNASSRALAAVRLASGASFSEDVFGSCKEGSDTVNQLRQRAVDNARQFSSEASSSSAAFSFYQMPPESRNSSGHDSHGIDHSLSQYDGSAASSHVSRGAYYSIRQSDLEIYGQTTQDDRSDAGNSGRHGVSPLPVRPYTRMQSTQVDSQASTGSYIDAATAAVQERPSPLEPLATHYQQLIEAQHAPQSNHWISAHSLRAHHNARNRNSSSYTHARQATDRLPRQYPAHHYPATSPPAMTALPSQASGRTVQSTRANQRSSENAPVRPPAQSSGPSRNSQVQIHRAAFERLHNAMQANQSSSPDVIQQGPSRLSLPPPPGSHADVAHGTSSRRRTPHLSSSPPYHVEQNLASLNRASTPPTPLDFPAQNPPSHGSHTREAAQRPATRHAPRMVRGRRSTPQFRPARVHDTVGTLSTMQSSGVNAASSRQPRRVPPQQLDQENSGAGEEELMRREAEAIRARHGEEVHDAVIMDETPPRVGRVERRMFS